ncbi:AGC family protein kinase [Histomonas meleagridis]|uniref:AGC family protein kinase n=1 Tax=Histomonas meleagridis TaxID=135588 RepID=UPI00355A3D75|nr:AGC family protein kinase [Histomonas meleagridis]KAH0804740.1 AGC family protein kinase [Histomonas meleagridis]
MSTQEGVIKQGYAGKLGGIFKTFRKRWFVLQGEELKYYKKPGHRVVGFINIKEAEELGIDPKSKHQNGIFIREIKRVHNILYSTPQEAQEWLKALTIVKQGVKKADVKITDFTVLKVIGRGAYGKVQLVRHNGDGQIYALKSLSKRLLAQYDLIGRTLTERNTLITANHPFITSARYSFQSDTKLFLALEYVPGGELFARLREERKFPEHRVKLYVAQLTLAIGYLHSIGIIHRDLKPENILVDKDGYLKITDFGLVKEKMNDSNAKTSTFCGTPDYIAPEMILSKPYNKSVDWWSMGILTYEMLYGYPPFYNSNTNAMYRAILNDPLEFPKGGTTYAKDFISQLLNRDPEKRLGSGPTEVEEIKMHPFFSDVDWKQLLLKAIPMEWKPDLSSTTDTSQFDKEFTEEQPVVSYENPDLISSETQKMLEGFTMENTNVID